MYNPAIQLKTGDFWVTFWPGSASGFTLHLCKAEGECIIAKLTHSEYASQFDFSEVQAVFQKRNPMKTLWQLYQNPFKSQFNGNPRRSLQIFWVIQGGFWMWRWWMLLRGLGARRGFRLFSTSHTPRDFVNHRDNGLINVWFVAY